MLLYPSLLNMPEYIRMCLYKEDSGYDFGPKYGKVPNMTGFSICEHFTAF